MVDQTNIAPSDSDVLQSVKIWQKPTLTEVCIQAVTDSNAGGHPPSDSSWYSS